MYPISSLTTIRHTTPTRRTSERSLGTFQQGDAPSTPTKKKSLTIAFFTPLLLHLSLTLSLSLSVFKNINKVNSCHTAAAAVQITGRMVCERLNEPSQVELRTIMSLHK